MLSAKDRTITIPRDVLLQLQRGIADLLQLVGPKVSPTTKDISLDGIERIQQLQHVSDSINSRALPTTFTKRKNTDNVVAILEKLQEVCEQHLLIANLDTFKENENEKKNILQDEPDKGSASHIFDVDLANAEQRTSYIKERWQELKAQMLQRYQKRIAATEIEYEAYLLVLMFAEKYGNDAYELAAEWINKAAEAIELRKFLLETEIRWEESRAIRQSTQNFCTTIVKEQQAKKKKVEDIRKHLAALDKQKFRLRPEYQSPGHYALKYWDAKEPFSKWAGPRQELRFISYCNICRLTGVERTDDCPNYSQHYKWLDGLLEEYKYS